MLTIRSLKSLIWKSLNYLHKYIAAPRMIMGYKNANGAHVSNTRISNTTSIISPEHLYLGDNIFIGHYNFIEASNKITIEEGCQISNYVSISSHSSHISIRLYGDNYTKHKKHIGYVAGPISIGRYSFIGPHSTIMPNSSIGKGSIVIAYSMVKGNFPDFAIISGNPAKVTGDTRQMDKKYLDENPDLQALYDKWAKGK